MKKFNVKLIWKEIYTVNVEAENYDDAEQTALLMMENAELSDPETIYADCKIKEIN